MTLEQARAAVTRWGNAVLALALLLCNRRVAAEAATTATFAYVLARQSQPEIEHTLYASMFQQLARRRRLPRWPRQGALPRELARMEPVDRFVLGLWLLRGLDGQQIAAVTGLSSQQIGERLALVLEHGAGMAPTSGDDGHITLAAWLAGQLSLPSPRPSHPRPCSVCHARQSEWEAARDQLHTLLRSVQRQAQLSQASQEAIAELLTAQPNTPGAWWQRRNIWLGGLIGMVALTLALLVMPRGTGNPAQAPPAVEARALVQGTLHSWFAADKAQPVHQQVWARDPRLHNGEPVVTHLWLAEQGSTRHRVEVWRRGQLVEWQLADGQARLEYAAEPADSSCQWNTGWSGNYSKLFVGPQRFSVSAEELRLVRDARLAQGAYGVGYLALQRALMSADLRSFGARIEGKRRLVLLQYTDTTTQPGRQIILRIDPVTQQLHAVQEVQVVNTQAHSTDLWKLELNEVAAQGVPLVLPAGPRSVPHERLLDPSCPALNPQFVVSPRTLLHAARPSYVPTKLPPDVERLVLLASDQTGLGSGRVPSNQDAAVSLLMVGHGRWFNLNDAVPAAGDESIPLTRGRWQVALNGPGRDGVWNGRLRPMTRDGRVLGPISAFWARGWSREEILALIESLAPFDSATWLALNGAFLDARPLSGEVDEAVRGALQALQPQPHTTIELRSTTRVRAKPRPSELPDPYHIPAAQRFPATLMRHQLLQFDDAHVARYHDRRTLPDGALYELRQVDGRRFHWYSNSRGITYTGDEALLRAFVRAEPADVALLTSLFVDDAPIKRSVAFDHVLLEQVLQTPPADDHGFTGPALPQTPWYEELPLGQWVRQIWLDSSTYRPLALTITHRRPDGSETYVQETTITERRTLDKLPVAMFSFDGLPKDTFTIDVDYGSGAVTETIEQPSRLLSWPATVGLKSTDTATVPAGNVREGDLALNGDWRQPTGVAASTSTTYSDDGNVVFRLTQAPSVVLRHVLRHQPLPHDSSTGAAWERSQRFRVEIVGQAHDAWLLTAGPDAALVVEVDELLLHFSGAADYLAGPLLELLPLLEWTQP